MNLEPVILNCLPKYITDNYVRINKNMNNTKDIINRYIGKECEECFINRLFSGV
jgi:hypothetical protein